MSSYDAKTLLFATYLGDRKPFEVSPEQTVGEIKEVIRDAFHMGPVDGPSGLHGQKRKVLSVFYAGSNLDNSWILLSLGIRSGSTLKVRLTKEAKPSMFVFCAFNGKTVPIMQKMDCRMMMLDTFRGIVSQVTGLPVSIFRLMSNKEPDLEMFDQQSLYDYGVSNGDTITLLSWDGWNSLLKLAISGPADRALSKISKNFHVSRFQQRVCLYLAAYFGRQELTFALLKLGVRPDEPVGTHPSRVWCKDGNAHVDCLTTPVHMAAYSGHVSIIRIFVQHDVCCVRAKDGRGLTPLSIALRNQQKACASFLFTKQWMKVDCSKDTTIPLAVFDKMKRWCNMAREKVYTIHGQWKSSLKSAPYKADLASLVGQSIQVDGLTKNKMCSRSETEARLEEIRERDSKTSPYEFDEPNPEVYFNALIATFSKLPKINNRGGRYRNMSRSRASMRGSRQGRNSSRLPSTYQNRLNLPPISEQASRRGVNVRDSRQSMTSVFTQDGGQDIAPTLKPPESQMGMYDVPESRIAVSVPPPTAKVQPVPPRRSNSSDSVVRKRDFGLGTLAKRSRDDLHETLSRFEAARGRTSEDFVERCLCIGQSFKEKSYLQQINQAALIARMAGTGKLMEEQTYVREDTRYTEMTADM